MSRFVASLITDSLSRVLLVRHRNRAWELPGGHIEPGERPGRAARRECGEETGVFPQIADRPPHVAGDCSVFFGVSEHDPEPNDPAIAEALWLTREEVRGLTLSDLPGAEVLQEWAGLERAPAAVEGAYYDLLATAVREAYGLPRTATVGEMAAAVARAQIDPEDLWADYRAERGTVTKPARDAFLAGVAAGRRNPTPALPEDVRAAAEELLRCAESWDPGARVMGNVTAEQVVSVARTVLSGQGAAVPTSATGVMAETDATRAMAAEIASLRADLGREQQARAHYETCFERATEEREEARAWVRRITSAERVLTCAFCGDAYPPGTPENNDAALTAHVRVCLRHPMREAERERDAARAEIASLRAASADLTEWAREKLADMTCDEVGHARNYGCSKCDLAGILAAVDAAPTPATVERVTSEVLAAVSGPGEELVTRLAHGAEVREIVARGMGAPTPEPEPACTGQTAVWCPIHGDCSCPYLYGDPTNGPTLDDDKCPLHKLESAHGEEVRTPEAVLLAMLSAYEAEALAAMIAYQKAAPDSREEKAAHVWARRVSRNVVGLRSEVAAVICGLPVASNWRDEVRDDYEARLSGERPIHAPVIRASRGEVPPDVRAPQTPEVAPPIDWRPTLGARVVTAEKLTSDIRGTWSNGRRAGTHGEVRCVFAGHATGRCMVRHDDGTEAPYDVDELRPAPTLAAQADLPQVLTEDDIPESAR